MCPEPLALEPAIALGGRTVSRAAARSLRGADLPGRPRPKTGLLAIRQSSRDNRKLPERGAARK